MRIVVDGTSSPVALPGGPEPAAPVPLRPRHTAATVAIGVPVSLAVALQLGPAQWTFVAGAAAFVLVWLAAIDLEARVVPNWIVLPATATVLAVAVALDPVRGGKHALAAFAAGGILLVAAVVRPGGLGMGDVKLAAFLGALLGSAVAYALTVGFALLALVALVMLARRGRVALKYQLPLAPFLVAGALTTLLVG